MIKAGIITIIDFFNLGNRLQNYAVQEFFKKYGINPHTILRDALYPTNDLKWKLKNIFFAIYEKCTLLHSCMINQKLVFHKMYKFTKHHIKLSPYVIEGDVVPEEVNKKYEIFFSGSDQVWNPNVRSFCDVDFLEFADKKKRNSISASFGIENIPEEKRSQFKRMLSEMNRISVREKRGQDLVKELCGKEATLLLDPTMLLTKEEWLKIKSKKHFSRKPYVLILFLGKATGDVYRSEIETVVKQYKLKCISILDFADKNSKMVSPDEFITLISDAMLVLTDSFHGTVFSIIMEKPFIVFDRKEKKYSEKNEMKSRIETLLSRFESENRTIELLKKNGTIFKVDYSKTKNILTEEREKAVKYIGEVIKDYRE